MTVRTRVPLAALGCAVVLAGCGIAARQSPVAVPAATPGQAASGAAELTRSQLGATLGGAGLQVTDPQVTFRPSESPALAAAPRTLVQVILPEDLGGGFIVIYEFPDPATAAAAGKEMAQYLVSGPGRIQYPEDARHVLRQVGTTLVFFSWSPSTSPDPLTPEIEQALGTVGIGVELPVR
jgi:hypothetical protein